MYSVYSYLLTHRHCYALIQSVFFRDELHGQQPTLASRRDKHCQFKFDLSERYHSTIQITRFRSRSRFPWPNSRMFCARVLTFQRRAVSTILFPLPTDYLLLCTSVHKLDEVDRTNRLTSTAYHGTHGTISALHPPTITITTIPLRRNSSSKHSRARQNSRDWKRQHPHNDSTPGGRS